MQKVYLLLLVILASCNFAMAKEVVPVMGNWQGEFTTEEWEEYSLWAQIVADSWNSYHAILYVKKDDVEHKLTPISGKTQKNITHFEGRVDLGEAMGGAYIVTGDASQGVFEGTFKGQEENIQFELRRVLLKSPTLGKKPPEGAIVLILDENKWSPENEKLFYKEWNTRPRWVQHSDGAFRPTGSSTWTKKKFADALYHIEFQTPYMPNEQGQGRGNSGVYVQGRYEIQVLDSFALEPANNLCGGIYQYATPRVNACLPPLEWQTYDITFYAPRFDENGNKTKNAELTVEHNGIVIHDKLELKHASPGGLSNKEATVGALLFQDHSDSVGYRNVWVKPLTK